MNGPATEILEVHASARRGENVLDIGTFEL
jgi:hypothetical protein